MSAPSRLTALVLAGSRSGGDALAAHAGVSHKALIEIGGCTMLERVVRTLAASRHIDRIVVAIELPQLVEALPPCGKPVAPMVAAEGPSASVAAVLRAEGAPLLVTTADHALLTPEIVDAFLSAAPSVDAVIALARRETVLAAAPGTQRTFLRFSDGDYSGCNLFLLARPAAMEVVRLWQELEADRKRPLAMLARLGPAYAIRYRLGKLSLQGALDRVGELSGARLGFVLLEEGRAAIDVDKPADLDLVRRLLET